MDSNILNVETKTCISCKTYKYVFMYTPGMVLVVVHFIAMLVDAQTPNHKFVVGLYNANVLKMHYFMNLNFICQIFCHVKLNTYVAPTCSKLVFRY